MYRKAVWFIFVCTITILALWFIVKAGMDVYRYYTLNTQVEAVVSQWEVKEIKSNQFAVLAQYDYLFQEKAYSGQGKVGGLYPNPWAAQEAKTRFSNQKWKVWIDPHRPGKSVLQKSFPLKRTISAAVLIALAIYFLILASYVRVKHG